MILFIASWAMLFAALFFAYGLIRLRAVAWPPPTCRALPLALPALATAVLALRQPGAAPARRAGATGRGGPVAAWRWPRWPGRGVFLALQLVVWRELWLAGLRPGPGPTARSSTG